MSTSSENYILQIQRNEYLDTILEFNCLASAKPISGVISKLCEYTLQISSGINITNIPIISSVNCFEKMKRSQGVAPSNFKNSYDNICLLEKSQINMLNNIIGNGYLHAAIIKEHPKFNASFLLNSFISLCFVLAAILLVLKCINTQRTILTHTTTLQIPPAIIIEDTRDQHRPPEREVDEILSTQDEMPDCSICIEPIKPNSSIVKLPCSHIFHPECIKQWFKGSKRCPNCNDPGSNRIILEPLNIPVEQNDNIQENESLI